MTSSKVALVTGASSGIGEAAAHGLLKQGFEVYVAARRVERMADLGAAGAHVVSLDVTDEASMVACIEQIKSEQGRLDVLVNNAGYGSYGALEDVPIDEARRQFEVNIFGLARLTQLALPMMREQRSGRIINISSVGARLYEPFGSWYHATKYAVEGLSNSLRIELAPFGIGVTIVAPAGVMTEWNTIARDSLLERSGNGAYAKLAKRAYKVLENFDKPAASTTADVVGKAIVKAATSRRAKTVVPVGKGARLVRTSVDLLPPRAFDLTVKAVFGSK